MTCVTLRMYQSRLASVTYISAEVAPPPTPIFYSYIYMTSVTFMSSLSLCLTECVSHLCDRRASLLLLKYEGDTCYMCCSVLQCVAVCCSVLQCVAVCCSVLQCVAVCCSVAVCPDHTCAHHICDMRVIHVTYVLIYVTGAPCVCHISMASVTYVTDAM